MILQLLYVSRTIPHTFLVLLCKRSREDSSIIIMRILNVIRFVIILYGTGTSRNIVNKIQQYYFAVEVTNKDFNSRIIALITLERTLDATNSN